MNNLPAVFAHPDSLTPDGPGPVVNLMDVFAARVRAGEPLHIVLPSDEGLVRSHLAVIKKLREVTGKPVHVIYS